jgi:hypothetical protein
LVCWGRCAGPEIKDGCVDVIAKKSSAGFQPLFTRLLRGNFDNGTMTHNYRVGQRVSFEGQLCTIRYIGEVQGTAREWLGVEWDNPSRGKHDGQGLFKCMLISLAWDHFLNLNRCESISNGSKFRKTYSKSRS